MARSKKNKNNGKRKGPSKNNDKEIKLLEEVLAIDSEQINNITDDHTISSIEKIRQQLSKFLPEDLIYVQESHAIEAEAEKRYSEYLERIGMSPNFIANITSALKTLKKSAKNQSAAERLLDNIPHISERARDPSHTESARQAFLFMIYFMLGNNKVVFMGHHFIINSFMMELHNIAQVEKDKRKQFFFAKYLYENMLQVLSIKEIAHTKSYSTLMYQYACLIDAGVHDKDSQGWIQAPNKEIAMRCLKKSAGWDDKDSNSGLADAQYDLGLMFIKQQKFDEAQLCFEAALNPKRVIPGIMPRAIMTLFSMMQNNKCDNMTVETFKKYIEQLTKALEQGDELTTNKREEIELFQLYFYINPDFTPADKNIDDCRERFLAITRGLEKDDNDEINLFLLRSQEEASAESIIKMLNPRSHLNSARNTKTPTERLNKIKHYLEPYKKRSPQNFYLINLLNLYQSNEKNGGDFKTLIEECEKFLQELNISWAEWTDKVRQAEYKVSEYAINGSKLAVTSPSVCAATDEPTSSITLGDYNWKERFQEQCRALVTLGNNVETLKTRASFEEYRKNAMTLLSYINPYIEDVHKQLSLPEGITINSLLATLQKLSVSGQDPTVNNIVVFLMKKSVFTDIKLSIDDCILMCYHAACLGIRDIWQTIFIILPTTTRLLEKETTDKASLLLYSLALMHFNERGIRPPCNKKQNQDRLACLRQLVESLIPHINCSQLDLMQANQIETGKMVLKKMRGDLFTPKDLEMMEKKLDETSKTMAASSPKISKLQQRIFAQIQSALSDANIECILEAKPYPTSPYSCDILLINKENKHILVIEVDGPMHLRHHLDGYRYGLQPKDMLREYCLSESAKAQKLQIRRIAWYEESDFDPITWLASHLPWQWSNQLPQSFKDALADKLPAEEIPAYLACSKPLPSGGTHSNNPFALLAPQENQNRDDPSENAKQAISNQADF